MYIDKYETSNLNYKIYFKLNIMRSIIFFYMISIVSAHTTLKLLLSKETAELHEDLPQLSNKRRCLRSNNNMGSIIKTFLSKSTKPIETWKYLNISEFCYFCRYKKPFVKKYLKNEKLVDNYLEVLEEIESIVNILDMNCGYEWDYGVRGLNKMDAITWIHNWKKKEIESKNFSKCEFNLQRQSFISISAGAMKQSYLLAKAANLLKYQTSLIALATVYEDMNSIDNHIQDCFHLVNALSHFRPDVCTSVFGTVIKKICPRSCKLIEGRIVQTALNDCCGDCMNNILDIDENTMDKIDLFPYSSWKEI